MDLGGRLGVNFEVSLGMKKLLGILALSIILTSCVAVGNVTLEVEEKIDAPKIIALNVTGGGPWMREVEGRLKKAGFKVLRAASVNEAIERDGQKIIRYKEASTRYFLLIDAGAAVDWYHRCFGGGFNFDFINADLIDLTSNETIASINSRGYSENCPPMSGKIFTNITKMIVDSWK